MAGSHADVESPNARYAVLYLGVLDRNPRILPEVSALVEAAAQIEGRRGWEGPVARELAAWPEASAVCLQVLTLCRKQQGEGPIAWAGPKDAELAQLALQAGHAKFVVRLARGSLLKAADPQNQRATFDLITAFELSLTLVDAKLIGDCTRMLIERLRSHQRLTSEVDAAKRFAGLLLEARRPEESQALLQAAGEYEAELRQELQNVLQGRGSKLAQQPRAAGPPWASAPPSKFTSPSAQARAAALQEAVETGDAAEAGKVAREILSEPLPVERDDGFRRLRETALAALTLLGERQIYLAECQKTAAAQPSAERYLRVGEAALAKDDATNAYLEAFRLEPGNMVAAKALLAVMPPDGPERIPWFEAVLAREPELALNGYSFHLIEMYAARQELPRLAARLAEAPFRKGAQPNPFGVGEKDLLAVVERLQHLDPPSAAIVMKKVEEVLTSPRSARVRHLLIAQLGIPGARKLSEVEVVDLLLPLTPPDAGGGSYIREQALAYAPVFDERALRFAHGAGMSAALLQRAKVSNAADPAVPATATFLRVLDRDPSVLPEVTQLAATLKENDGWMDTILPIARELAAWPEASSAVRPLLIAIKARLRDGSPRYIMGAGKGRELVADLALQAGLSGLAVEVAQEALQDARDPDDAHAMTFVAVAYRIALAVRQPALLQECNVLLIQRLQGGDPSGHVGAEAIRVTADFIDAHLFDAAAELLTALEARADQNQNADSVRALRTELAMHRGKIDQLAPVVWLDPARSTPARAAVVWDLSLTPREKAPIAVLFAERPAAMAEANDWTAELHFGESAGQSRLIARMPGVGPRGTWQGGWPANSGFWSVILTHAGQRFAGPPTPCFAGANLVHPAVAEPAQDAAHASALKEGGPLWEGQYLALSTKEERPMKATTISLGQPVKILPNREYELTGWLHGRDARAAELKARFLDAQRQPLPQSGAPSERAGDWTSLYLQRWWHYSQLRLSPASLATGEIIPDGAVFLDPLVRIDGQACDVAGVSLILVPLTP